MSIKLKVGDKIQAVSGTSAHAQYGKCEVLNIHGGYVVLVSQGGVPFVRDLRITEDYWVKVSNFFEIGKTYAFGTKLYAGHVIYKVMDLYHIDQPAGEQDGDAAVLMVTDEDGASYITIGTHFDFKRMREV